MAVTPASMSSLKVMTWWLTTIVALHDECMALSVNGVFASFLVLVIEPGSTHML